MDESSSTAAVQADPPGDAAIQAHPGSDAAVPPSNLPWKNLEPVLELEPVSVDCLIIYIFRMQ